MTERDIFLAVLDLPDPAARTAYLESACGGDSARRARVEALLQAHENAGSFLAEPAAPVAAADRGATEAFSATSEVDGTQTAGGASGPDDEALTFLSPPQRPDSLGRIGHYEVLEVLGRGGFGIVFRAFDEVLQRVVAVKVLAPTMAATSPARKRFLREARSSAQVRHENVVQVYAVEEQPLPYLVMEYIPGETLQQRLDRTGPLDVPEILRIGRQIADGLAAAHAQGLIHRDVKPGNVLIEGGPAHRAKLTDFGLARAADDASISQSGVVAGTPMYMAPEQAKGETLDHRADLFSLGSVLYVMCSGRPPFRASGTLAVLKRVCEEDPRPIREVIPEVPAWLCNVVAKLHAKDPAERFQTSREVADLLGQHLAHLQEPNKVAMPAPVAPPWVAKPRRRFTWRRIVVPIGILLVAATGLFVAYGPTIQLYRSNTGLLQLDGSNGAIQKFVIRGAGVETATLRASGGMTGVPTMRTGNVEYSSGDLMNIMTDAGYHTAVGIAPGIYRVTAIAENGESVQKWRVDASGLFSSYSLGQDGEDCTVEIKRGERMQLSIDKWAPEQRLPAGQSPESLSDRDRLRGSWSVVSIDRPGPPLSPEYLNTMKLTVRGRNFHFSPDDDIGSILLDTNSSPKRIDLIRDRGRVTTNTAFGRIGRSGIYRFDGDRLVICMGEESVLPLEFKTDPQFPTRSVIVLRRDENGGPSVADSSGVNSIAGTWESVGGPVTLEHGPIEGRSAVTLSGFYLLNNDKNRGVITRGTYYPFKRTAQFEFAEPWWGGTGSVELTLSADGNELGGTWRNSKGEGGAWQTMRRPQPSAAESGWVQIFNGKDLTGWKTHPDEPGDWRVDDGILIGSRGASYLFSDRGDYENAHIRVEAKINKGGNSGVLFHSKYGFDFALPVEPVGTRVPLGYEVEFASASNIRRNAPAASSDAPRRWA